MAAQHAPEDVRETSNTHCDQQGSVCISCAVLLRHHKDQYVHQAVFQSPSTSPQWAASLHCWRLVWHSGRCLTVFWRISDLWVIWSTSWSWIMRPEMAVQVKCRTELLKQSLRHYRLFSLSIASAIQSGNAGFCKVKALYVRFSSN